MPMPSVSSPQKKNFTFGGTAAFQTCLAPSMDVIPMKKDRYAEDAEYSPFSVHLHTKRQAERLQLDAFQLLPDHDVLT